MRALTERAVDAADVCLFLIDARAGVTALDRVLAELLRKRAARVILAANKYEGRAAESGLLEAWELGLGEPLAISAEHGIGVAKVGWLERDRGSVTVDAMRAVKRAWDPAGILNPGVLFAADS